MTYRRFLRAAGLLVLTACLTAAWAVAQTPASPHHEVRAVWLTTIGGLDWPSQPATTEAGARRQQQELCRMMRVNRIKFYDFSFHVTSPPSS